MELRSCPGCGKPAEAFLIEGSRSGAVQCTSCGLAMMGYNLAAAVERWNAPRPVEEDLRGEIRQLREQARPEVAD